MSSSKMDELKNKIRSTSASSVHPELIDTSHEDKPKPKPKKKKFEETHTRDTVWIENDLKKKIDSQSAENGRGEKTRIINEALRLYFNEAHK
ncbi:hypothetical protein QP794_32045 [Paenibacillus sp. UMB7766-LJ446]|uniref:Ribbon-helix-helix protein CopG domain-containing protein n=1 Tax=Paenibacillus urinalis TaxID=521520 RepID=A0AAX3N9U3_9BACL|nr:MULTISPECIES: hypothetical protein [Paenibacillus]MDK8194725.1 hypothetical protein [Paenibacillus sp. UMB7766-LJ446]WDH85515.1 hypothetical protein PUW23_26480 [Paenibacillus urinalis]SDX85384.1 hypothetical protein SAMN05518848_1206 [Paenibacillus sp. PDC88]